MGKGGPNMDLSFRFFDSYSRTMDSLRPAFKTIEARYKEQDLAVNNGLGYLEDSNLNHGLSQGGVNSGVYDVVDIVYNSKAQEYFTVNKFGELKRWTWSGRPLPDPPKQPSKKFKRFLYIEHSHTYVCWTPLKKSFYIAKEDFSIAIDAEALAPIKDIIYGQRKAEEHIDFFILADTTATRYSYNQATNVVILQECSILSDAEAIHASISAYCFDHPDEDRKQWIYFAFADCCSVMDVMGRFHGSKKKLHETKVTAIVASKNSDVVVTGDQKGYLKLWGSKKWVFVAEIRPHNCAVSHLALHPSGDSCISFASDLIIFTWSFETLNKLDRVHSPEIVEHVCVNKDKQSIMTQGAMKLVLWRVDTLYHLHTLLSSPLRRVDLTWHPDFPQRAYALCEDNSIRVINPVSGTVITSVLVNTPGLIRQAAYHKNKEMDTMWVVAPDATDKLEVQQYDCTTNPANLKETWDEAFWDSPITALNIYDYVPSYEIEHKETHFSSKKKEGHQDRIIHLIVGHKDGQIGTVDIATGDTTYSTKCHKSAVARIEVNNQLGQFISLGVEPSLRIWKIITNQDETFVPLLDISWKHPIRFTAWVRQYLCFALTNANSAQHRTIVYDIAKAERHDSEKSTRHTREIVSLSGCPELVLFCSAGLDEMIRIWNHENTLVRALVMNCVPSAAGFSSKQGDIFVGVKGTIQVILAEKYLPIIYRNRAMKANLGPGAEEIGITLQVSKTKKDDPRMAVMLDERVEYKPVGAVKEFGEVEDSQQTRDKELLRERELDIIMIVEGRHPREPGEPDLEKMTKKEWDDYVKSVDEGEDEERKYFIGRPRKDALLKMREMKKDLDDYKNIM